MMRQVFDSVLVPKLMAIIVCLSLSWDLYYMYIGLGSHHQTAGLMFLIWTAPALASIVSGGTGRSTAMTLTMIAMVMAIVGHLASLSIIRNFALAFAIGGLVSPSAKRMLWLACAVGWMPSFVWLCLQAGVEQWIEAIRVVVVLVGVAGVTFDVKEDWNATSKC